MSVIVWWFVLMLPAWALAAYILWGTSVVVDDEDEGAEDE